MRFESHNQNGRGARVALTVAVATGLVAFIVGCQRDIVEFNRLDEGKKHLAADQSFQAAKYFTESLDQDPDSTSVAYAHLAVAHDRSFKKVNDIPPERVKYEEGRAEALAHVRQDADSIATLVSILEYHDQSSQSAEEILIELGPLSVEALVRGYTTKPTERGTIRRILTAIGPAGADNLETAYTKANLSPADAVRLVRIIGSVGGESARSFMTALRNDATAHEGVRVEAASALYRLGEKGERDYLIAGIESGNAIVRRASAYSLTFLNDAPKTELLVNHLSDTDDRVRLHLVTALGKYGSAEVTVGALLDVLLTDESNDVANAAVVSLARFAEGVIDPTLDALAADADDATWTRRQRLVRLLSEDAVRAGFDTNREFKLYEHWQKREKRAEVRSDIATLLDRLENDTQ